MIRNILCGVAAMLIGGLPWAAYAQTCNSQTPDDAPSSRYQAQNDGTAMDRRTGLMWMRCAMGQKWDANNTKCTGDVKTYTWQEALQAVQSLNQGSGFAGHNDWRLPNLRELMSIERFHCSNPSINLTIFPAAPATAVWSASPLEGAFNIVWALDYGTGHVVDYAMTSQHSVRLVRAGAFDNTPPPTSSANAAVVN